MHRLRPFLTIPIALVVIILAVANRHDVTVHLFPLPWDIDVPLYALLILVFALGAAAGGFAMWAGRLKRQRKQRAKAVARQEKAALRQQKSERAKEASPVVRGPARVPAVPPPTSSS